MLMLRLFLFLFICATISSCNKDDYTRIKYRVVSKNSFDIVYSVNGNTFTEFNEKGERKSSYRVKKGSDFLLTAIKKQPPFELSILIYMDGELFGRQDTKEVNEFITLSGIVP